MITLLQGDACDVLATLPERSIQCCITSPPYFGLRAYGSDPREIGREQTPAEYVAALIAVFRAVWRVLRDDGTLWLNLGDSYNGGGGYSPSAPSNVARGAKFNSNAREFESAKRKGWDALPQKNLLGIPWRVAFALQDAGWILRSDIIWAKPNPMPESVRDRPTRSHEYVFMFAKQARYFYDQAAISEAATQPIGIAAHTGQHKSIIVGHNGRDTSKLGTNQGASTRNRRSVWTAHDPADDRAAFGLYLSNLFRQLTHAGVDETTIGAAMRAAEADNAAVYADRRDVWTIATQPYAGAHFATMPEALIEPCMLAGSASQACETCGAAWGRQVERESASADNPRDWQGVPEYQSNRNGRSQEPKKIGAVGTPTIRDLGFAPRCRCETNTGAGRSIVLDPFLGSGTVAKVAERFQRDSIGIDLNAEYIDLQEQRTNGVQVEFQL